MTIMASQSDKHATAILVTLLLIPRCPGGARKTNINGTLPKEVKKELLV